MKKFIKNLVLATACLPCLFAVVATKTNAVTLEVLDPRGVIPTPPFHAPAERIKDLDGKKVGIYWIGKAGGDNFWDGIEELLNKKYPNTTTVRYRGDFDIGDELAAKIAGEVDTVFYGVGDWGSCTWAGGLGTARLEKLGIPTVYLTTSQFNEDAHLSAQDNGVPNMRIVAVAADRFYRERINKERARPVAEEYFDAMMTALTTPITDKEKRPEQKNKSTGLIKVTGASYDIALENFNEMFLANQWSDGLPVVPPTPERVAWMLKGTNRAPDEKIGTISPRNGMATIEKIAINAVMAGAKPEYLPVIIAAVEGLADPQFDDLHFATSTGSFNLVIAVSGPIAEEIGMNSGLGLLSYGNRANSTIGRAVRMSVINLGHTWPAFNDMALVGRPGAHTFLTFAENQAQSPWEPYRVSHGFNAGDSTVTLTVTGSYGGMGGIRAYGGGAVALVPPESIVKRIIDDATARHAGSITRGGVEEGRSMFGRSHLRHLVIFNPEVAQELHERLGFSSKSLQQYIYEQTSIPYEDLSDADIASVQQAIKSGYIPVDRVSVFEAGLKPGGKVPSLLRPEDVDIIVAGGIPGYTVTTSGYLNGIYKPLAQITKPVRGAALTNSGV